jgi:hypothetical protein
MRGTLPILAGLAAVGLLTACAPSGPLTQEEANRWGAPMRWAVMECGDIQRDGEVSRNEDYVFIGQTRYWGVVYTIEQTDGDFVEVYARMVARVDGSTLQASTSEAVIAVDCGDGRRAVV